MGKRKKMDVRWGEGERGRDRESDGGRRADEGKHRESGRDREKGEKGEKGRGKETEIHTCWFLSDGHCRQIVDDVVKLSTFCHVLLQHRHAVLNQHLGQIREDM